MAKKKQEVRTIEVVEAELAQLPIDFMVARGALIDAATWSEMLACGPIKMMPTPAEMREHQAAHGRAVEVLVPLRDAAQEMLDIVNRKNTLILELHNLRMKAEGGMA